MRLSRRTTPLPFGLALVGLLAAIAIPALIAQLWWRSKGMCDDGFSCQTASLYVAAPAVVVGGLIFAATYLRKAPAVRSDLQPAMLVALVVAQLFFAAPIDAELNNTCNIMTGTTIRALKVDQGPFTIHDPPIFGPAAVTQMGCGLPEDAAVWRWGSLGEDARDAYRIP